MALNVNSVATAARAINRVCMVFPLVLARGKDCSGIT
ncbi:hypothetical protein GALL_485930 [mine drainage metagenome]|uniref:Uncharacterized protein n=1 Tax=mine drainage metagenome TaxID=410659 RepID=A0A1J5PQF2_9ZZZZ